MANQKDGQDPERHKGQRRDEGPRGETRIPANAVTARATIAKGRSNPDENSRQNYEGQTDRKIGLHEFRLHQAESQRRADQAEQKEDPPASIPFIGRGKTARNSGDAGNAAQ